MRPSIFLAILLLFTACGGQEEVVVETKIRAVRAGEVVMSDGSRTQTYSGVASAAGVTPLSFRVGGTVRSIQVKLGDRVKRGQLLATIDPADLQVQRSQASANSEASAAQLESAETQLIAAKVSYERMTKLYENNSVALSDFEQARSQFQSAQAQVQAAKSQLAASSAQVQAARNQVRYTRLTAPFSGVITTLDVEPNEFIGSGKQVVTLSTEEEPEVSVNLPESVIGLVKTEMIVAVTFPAVGDQVFEGSVSEVSFAAGNAPSYPVMVRIKGDTDLVRPGMAANVNFTFADKTVSKALLLTPIESVTEGPEGRYVFKLIKQDTGNYYIAKKSVVTIGELYDEGFAVKDGLQKGDLVATAGLKQLLDGMEVRLLERVK